MPPFYHGRGGGFDKATGAVSVPSLALHVQVHWVLNGSLDCGPAYGCSLPLAGAVLEAVMGRIPRWSLPVGPAPQWLSCGVQGSTNPIPPGTVRPA